MWLSFDAVVYRRIVCEHDVDGVERLVAFHGTVCDFWLVRLCVGIVGMGVRVGDGGCGEMREGIYRYRVGRC